MIFKPVARSTATNILVARSIVLPVDVSASGLKLGAIDQSGLSIRETESGAVLSLSGDILFDFDSARLRPSSLPVLIQLLQIMRERNPSRIVIEGHTDALGSQEYNQSLGEDRALSVTNYLISKGYDTKLFEVVSFGESQPIAGNKNADGSDSPSGRQANRRVVVQLED